MVPRVLPMKSALIPQCQALEVLCFGPMYVRISHNVTLLVPLQSNYAVVTSQCSLQE
jgi:hypothetical protein